MKEAMEHQTGGDLEDCVVKLRGLPFTATKEDVIEFFSGLNIEKSGVQLMSGNKKKILRGDCYVQFCTTEEAMKALDRHMAEMGNRYIEVFSSSKQEASAAEFGRSIKKRKKR